MTSVTNARDAHAQMSGYLREEDYEHALASARHVMRLLKDDPKQRGGTALFASATQTTLICAAALDPEDDRLPARCDGVVAQFRDRTFRLAGVTVIVALGVKIQVLLTIRHTDEAQVAADELRAFYGTRAVGEDATLEAGEVVRIAANMVAMGLARPAAGLAGLVADRLLGATGAEQARLIARALIWSVVASVYAGDPIPGMVVPSDADALWAAFEADAPASAKESGEVDRLIGMGDDAIAAADMIAPKLSGPYWQLARIIIALLRIGVLDDLGRDQEAREYKRAFIKNHQLASDWPTETLVAWLQHELDNPAGT